MKTKNTILKLVLRALLMLSAAATKAEDITIYLPAGSPLRSSAIILNSNELAVLRYAVVDYTNLVFIVLESSIDLVTWNAASPGTYGTQTDKRFFRVRAQRVSGP